MKRRDFLATMALGTAGIYLQACTPARFLSGRGSMKNMAWISAKDDLTPEKLRKDFKLFKAHGLQGVLLSGSPEVHQMAAPVAHDEGIELHAWIMALRRTDQELKANHPEWFNVNRNGESSADHPQYVDYYNWLCPSRQEVRDFLTDVALKRARIPHMASVHLDYIRYPDVILPKALWEKYGIFQDKEYPQYDYCYCDVCRSKFEEQYGKDPLKLEHPAENENWKQYRYNQVTETVNQVARAVHNENLKVTAAVFPTPDIARRLVRQDWPSWNIDAFFPMMYHNFYYKYPEWIQEATKQGVKSIKKGQKLYSGVFVPELTPQEMAQTLNYAYKGGASGVTLFTGYTPTQEHWEAWDKTRKNYS